MLTMVRRHGAGLALPSRSPSVSSSSSAWAVPAAMSSTWLPKRPSSKFTPMTATSFMSTTRFARRAPLPVTTSLPIQKRSNTSMVSIQNYGVASSRIRSMSTPQTLTHSVMPTSFSFASTTDLRRPSSLKKLEEFGCSFIDVGVGLSQDEALGGILRVTTSTPVKRDHVHSKHRIPLSEGLDERNMIMTDTFRRQNLTHIRQIPAVSGRGSCFCPP